MNQTQKVTLEEPQFMGGQESHPLLIGRSFPLDDSTVVHTSSVDLGSRVFCATSAQLALHYSGRNEATPLSMLGGGICWLFGVFNEGRDWVALFYMRCKLVRFTLPRINFNPLD